MTILRNDGIEDEIVSKANELDLVINSLLLNVNTSQVNFKVVSQPFLFFTDDVLANGKEVKVDITVQDADGTPVIVKSSFTRFDDALAAVKIKNYNPVEIEIDPNSMTKHYFPYTNIEQGNSLKLEVSYNEGVPISKLVPLNFQKQKHYLMLPLSESDNRQQFVINSGGALLVDAKSNYANYYKCDAENTFSTQCFLSSQVPTHGMQFHKHLGATSGVSMTIASKQIATKAGDKTFYYFNWFDHQKLVWDYEVYDKKIVDVGHTITQGGETYTIIAFEDSIQIGRFFSGWTYGNRDVRVFDKDDVDVDSFCPSKIMFNGQQRNVVFILSNCNESQNLIKFEIQNPRSPKFIGSRWISSNEEPIKEVDACILPGEMILFGKSKNKDGQDQTFMTAYDREFSFTRSSIDSGVYKLSKFYDFACVPELNVFATLNDDSQGQSEESAKEIVIYNGGAAMQGMRRVLKRVSGLPSVIKSFQVYAQDDRVVVVCLDGSLQIAYLFNVDV